MAVLILHTRCSRWDHGVGRSQLALDWVWPQHLLGQGCRYDWLGRRRWRFWEREVLDLIVLQRRHLFTPTGRHHGMMGSAGRNFSLTRQSKLFTLVSEGRGGVFYQEEAGLVSIECMLCDQDRGAGHIWLGLFGRGHFFWVFINVWAMQYNSKSGSLQPLDDRRLRMSPHCSESLCLESGYLDTLGSLPETLTDKLLPPTLPWKQTKVFIEKLELGQ